MISLDFTGKVCDGDAQEIDFLSPHGDPLPVHEDDRGSTADGVSGDEWIRRSKAKVGGRVGVFCR